MIRRAIHDGLSYLCGWWNLALRVSLADKSEPSKRELWFRLKIGTTV